MIVLKLCPYLYTEGRVDDTKYIKKKYLKGVGIHLKYWKQSDQELIGLKGMKEG